MAKGGRRPGAGRPPGARNKRSVKQEEEIRASGQTPLEYLTSIYQDEKQPERMRLEAARIAAPYVHPRLSAVDMDVRGDNRDVDELSDAELVKIIRTSNVEPSDQKVDAAI